MRVTILFLFAIFFIQQVYAQSPFNYGQDKNAYYISKDEREKLGITIIYDISEQMEGETGGMNENWDIITTEFTDESITEDWSIINSSDNYQFNFDSIIEYARFINGTIYNLKNQQVTDYGGYGYGSFNYCDIEKINDTLSTVYASCTGHCGTNSAEYISKTIFNKNQQIIYSLIFPPEYPEQELEEETSENDSLINNSISINTDTIPDTIYYEYNSENQIIKIGDKKIDPENLKSSIHAYNEGSNFKFHQNFIDNIKMEVFIKSKIGYLPHVILFEIYRYGVLTFVLDSEQQKYYGGEEMILEI